MENTSNGPGRIHRIIVFLLVLIFGFAAFAAPAIFFQMGNAGGYAGHNFTIIGLTQLLLVVPMVLLALRLLRQRPGWIGLTLMN